MTYDQSIERMTPRHFKILDYSVAGLTNKQIAEKLNMSRVQVSVIIASPSFQHQFAIRRTQVEAVQAEHQADGIDEVVQTMKDGAKSAADKLISGISSQDEKIALKSAVEILDRTGYPKEQKMSGDVGAKTQIIIDSKELNILKESLDMDARNIKSEEAEINSEQLT